VLWYCLFYDIKYRKVPNKSFKFIFYISFILNCIEIFFGSYEKVMIIIFRFFFFIIVFIISILLYSFKFIGGSDGKLLIFIFLTIPFSYLGLTFISSYFLLFSVFYFIMIIINYTSNSRFKKKYSFSMLFHVNKGISILKILYIKSFYRFLDFSKLEGSKDEKFRLMSISLYYNAIIGEFHLLAEFRPPIILLCVISYYIFFFFF